MRKIGSKILRTQKILAATYPMTTLYGIRWRQRQGRLVGSAGLSVAIETTVLPAALARHRRQWR
eukprot:4477575-Pleurochrysis_carterae.AAC.1